MGAHTSRTALKILYKSSLEYLGTLVSDLGPEGPSGCSEISDLGGRGKSEGAMKGATEGAIEKRSWRRRPQPQTEIILELKLIFF